MIQDRDDLRKPRFKNICFDISSAKFRNNAAVMLHINAVKGKDSAHRMKYRVAGSVRRAFIAAACNKAASGFRAFS